MHYEQEGLGHKDVVRMDLWEVNPMSFISNMEPKHFGLKITLLQV